ncbi:T-box transcription factor T homolog [Mercenaria mercenaria]|uniref:T-box transcription factor T homolog n=1 Tax=Mercenaria mercenaria TaxID=6596 RepID=UPI001E1D6C4F|nr:T-box transcription factor T homolog [Mercenaria mercenaria]
MKTEDYIPPSKKHKLSLTPYKGNSPPATYLARNTDASDACLGDDAESPPSIPFLDVKLQDGGEIKRTCQGVSVSLHDENLWRAFAEFGTEMIINRGGRRMFPHIILSMEGLNPQKLYSVILEIVPADQRRYKFIHNQWMPMGMADPGPRIQPVTHPDSSNVGSFWMRNRTSFSKVRLTNSKDSSVKECSDGNILLLSMHKYKVVIKIKDESSPAKTELTFVFDESAFVAVTAYQNSKITQLKIQNNPFAKAFRDCHSSSFKSVSPRRRDAKSKNCFAIQSPQPTIPYPVSEFQPFLQYPPLPFQQVGFGMAALDKLSRNTADINARNVAPYLPWAAVGRQWSFPFWTEDSQALSKSLCSRTHSFRTPEVACMQLPVDLNKFRRSFSVTSQTSSCSSQDTRQQEQQEEAKSVYQN